jgi:hypothetical protein
MKTAKKIVLAVALLAGVGCARHEMQIPLQPSPQWVTFHSAAVRHEASFPERPKASVRESVAPTGQKAITHLYEVERNGQYFGTGWIPIPAAMPVNKQGRDRLLDVAMAAAVKSASGGKLLRSHVPVLEGYEGRLYFIDVPSQKLRIRQQIFVAGDGIIEQTFTGPPGTETDADAERFFASFRLLP